MSTGNRRDTIIITRIQTGTSFFDDQYGGVYSGRSALVSGRAGSGKTVFSLQFIMQGIHQGERCLLLSTRPANDLIVFAEGLGMPISGAIESGHLILMEYQGSIPGQQREGNIMLPPEGFLQLKTKIKIDAVKRVALDTILPWVLIRDYNHITEYVVSFVRAFDELGVTTLFTMPKPVSTIAFRLKNAIENVVPISINLSTEPSRGINVMIVNKYLGEQKLMTNREYVIVPHEGIREAAGWMPPSALQQASRRAAAGSFVAFFSPPAERTQPLKFSPTAPFGMSPNQQPLIHVCANCKRIRKDKDFWHQLEEYISTYFHVQCSHGICPECAQTLYGINIDEPMLRARQGKE